MIVGPAVALLRALARRASDSTPSPETQEPEPHPEDLICAPAAYIQPETYPHVAPSKIDRRCARCCGRYLFRIPADAQAVEGVLLPVEMEPLDLYWIGPELLCGACARADGHAQIDLDENLDDREVRA